LTPGNEKTYPSSEEGKHLVHKLAITELSASHHGSQDITLDVLLLVLGESKLVSLLVKNVMEHLPQVVHLARENDIRFAGDIPHEPLRQQ
jgi:hypothetical protein